MTCFGNVSRSLCCRSLRVRFCGCCGFGARFIDNFRVLFMVLCGVGWWSCELFFYHDSWLHLRTRSFVVSSPVLNPAFAKYIEEASGDASRRSLWVCTRQHKLTVEGRRIIKSGNHKHTIHRLHHHNYINDLSKARLIASTTAKAMPLNP